MTDVLGNIYRSIELEKEAAAWHDEVLAQVDERVQRWLQIFKNDPMQTHGVMLDVLDNLDHSSGKPFVNEFILHPNAPIVYVVIRYGDNEEFRTTVDMRILLENNSGFQAIEAEVAARIAEHKVYQQTLEQKNEMTRRSHRRALLDELAAEFNMVLVDKPKESQ